ncbi:MAG: hypothetical protein ABIL18_05895 [candidate division WOR-3 bacterium]
MKLILSCPLIFALLLFGQGVQIYLPEYNQKVKIDGIEVLGETSSGSDILWKIIVENSPFTTITKSLEMGGLEVSPFPIFNLSFGANVIVAHAWGPPQALSTDPADKEKDNDIYKHTEKKKGLEPLNFQVIFNKPMDTVSVREAMEVKNKDRDSDVEIKEITWDNDMKTMEVRCYDPVGEYES